MAFSEAKSGVLIGTVRHRRFRTTVREFKYKVFMTLINLNDVPSLFGSGRFWGTGKSLVQFKRDDYLPGTNNLLEEVGATLHKELGIDECGNVFLLTNPRIFGYLINPISVFFCYNKANSALQAIILEVTNTPWNERTRYALRCDPDSKIQRIYFGKEMHVSPFLPMNMQYELNCNTPNDKVAVHLRNLESGECVFDATLALDNMGNSKAIKRQVLLNYPWMTMKVFLAIHWQALKLFLLRVPVVTHPKQPSKNSRS